MAYTAAERRVDKKNVSVVRGIPKPKKKDQCLSNEDILWSMVRPRFTHLNLKHKTIKSRCYLQLLYHDHDLLKAVIRYEPTGHNVRHEDTNVWNHL